MCRSREGAHFTLGARQHRRRRPTLEIVTTVRHLAPDATSRQMVRSVLGGKATGTYLGKVAVARGAQQTDAEQSVRAMLLDRGATAKASPSSRSSPTTSNARTARGRRARRAAIVLLRNRAGSTRRRARALMLEGFIAGPVAGAPTTTRLRELRAAPRCVRAIA